MYQKSFDEWCIEHHREDLIAIWNSKKNGDIKNSRMSDGKKYWFTIDPNEEDISYSLSNIRSKKGGDPFKKFNNSFGHNVVKKYGKEYLYKIWSPTNDKSPYEFTKGSTLKIHVRCADNPKHPEHITTPDIFIRGRSTCPYCSHKKVLPEESFVQYHIDNTDKDFLAKYWSEENNIDPFTIAPQSNTPKILIKCQSVNYHLYSISPANFTRGRRCPYCEEGKKKTHYLDSLGYKYPQIINIWSDKNKHSPYVFRCNSHEKIWLKCEKGEHEDYLRTIKDYTVSGAVNCPMCTKERKVSYIEENVQNYILSLGYNLKCEYGCSIIAINPKTGFKMPYDNEIPELKLIIEVHGIQHYELSGWHITQSKTSGKTPEEEFQYQKQKDLIKKDYAINKGYNYLEVPYWAFESNKYKELIDDKIKQIKTSTVETAG